MKTTELSRTAPWGLLAPRRKRQQAPRFSTYLEEGLHILQYEDPTVAEVGLLWTFRVGALESVTIEHSGSARLLLTHVPLHLYVPGEGLAVS